MQVEFKKHFRKHRALKLLAGFCLALVLAVILFTNAKSATLSHLEKVWYERAVKKTVRATATVYCNKEMRVGTSGDGGKWVCNPRQLRKGCVVYGVGTGDEYSFDTQMAARYGCEVHMFDPAPSVIKALASFATRRTAGEGSMTFHPWGLGPVNDSPEHGMALILEDTRCETKRLDEIARRLGHERVDVLKMDIEGGEWPLLDDILARDLLRKLHVAQLQVEFHIYWFGEAKVERLKRLINRLDRLGYVVFHKELNPAGCCAEYAFVERGYLEN
jgi:FkbM family methyltransferase